RPQLGWFPNGYCTCCPTYSSRQHAILYILRYRQLLISETIADPLCSFLLNQFPVKKLAFSYSHIQRPSICLLLYEHDQLQRNKPIP
ncbi:MAG: hypothetical protein EXX96DRAFT_465612, partial [Benjaminiella poitrasii]